MVGKLLSEKGKGQWLIVNFKANTKTHAAD